MAKTKIKIVCGRVVIPQRTATAPDFVGEGTTDGCEDGPWAAGWEERSSAAQDGGEQITDNSKPTQQQSQQQQQHTFTLDFDAIARAEAEAKFSRYGFVITTTDGGKRSIRIGRPFNIKRNGIAVEPEKDLLDHQHDAALEELMAAEDRFFLGDLFPIETHTSPEALAKAEVVTQGWRDLRLATPEVEDEIATDLMQRRQRFTDRSVDTGDDNEAAEKKPNRKRLSKKAKARERKRRFLEAVCAVTEYTSPETEELSVSDTLTYRTKRAQRMMVKEAEQLLSIGHTELSPARARYYAAIFKELKRQRQQVERFDQWYAAQDALRSAKALVQSIESQQQQRTSKGSTKKTQLVKKTKKTKKR